MSLRMSLPEKSSVYLCNLFCIVLCLQGSQIWMSIWASHFEIVLHVNEHTCDGPACRLWPGDDCMVKSELLADTTVLLLPLFPFIRRRRTIVPLPYCLHKELTVSVMAAKCFSLHKTEDGCSSGSFDFYLSFFFSTFGQPVSRGSVVMRSELRLGWRPPVLLNWEWSS